MSRNVLIALLVVVGFAFVGAGILLNSWWVVAGGVFALTGGAWVVTEPR